MQHAHFEKPHSAKPIAIDVDGEPKGVLVASDKGFRFLAVKLDAFGVDGQIFATVEAAESALRESLLGVVAERRP